MRKTIALAATTLVLTVGGTATAAAASAGTQAPRTAAHVSAVHAGPQVHAANGVTNTVTKKTSDKSGLWGLLGLLGLGGLAKRKEKADLDATRR